MISQKQTVVSVRAGASDSATRTINNVLPGSILVVSCAIWNISGSTNVVTDNQNNIYNLAWTSNAVGTNARVYQYWAQVGAGGSIIITVNPTGATADIDFTVTELVQGVGVPPFVQTVIGTGALGTGASTGSFALPNMTYRNSVLISIFTYSPGNSRTLTAMPGWTQIDENENNATGQAFHAQILVVTFGDTDISASAGCQFGTDAAGSNWVGGCGIYGGAIRRRS